MKIEYAYKAGQNWQSVINELGQLIAQGAAGLSGIMDGDVLLSSVTGEKPGAWLWDGSVYLTREPGDGKQGRAWGFVPVTGGAMDGVMVSAAEWDTNTGSWGVEGVPVLACGMNSANGGAALANGVIRVLVTENAVAISFPYGASRQLALLGEADGDYFGVGAYPCHFAMSSQAVVAGAGMDAVSKVPYFPRVKNPAAAGDKVGMAAAGLAFAVGISATNGWVYGINEAQVYQGLPLDVFSSPKAAHLGYVRDVILAPCKNIANDDLLVIAGDEYTVFRENATAALAVALKA